MGWLKEKYTSAYFLKKDSAGKQLPYGVAGVEAWESGDVYQEVKGLLDLIDFAEANVLDIGFGRGEVMRYCLQRGAAHVTGVDFAQPAYDIARETLRDFGANCYKLHYAEARSFLLGLPLTTHYTHILMMDVIEHIPRTEMSLIAPEICRALCPGGLFIVHTPFFPEDDDVMVTGGKEACKDESDEFDATRGMHINRYSNESLGSYLRTFGFRRWNDFLFVKPYRLLRLPVWNYHGRGRRRIAKFLGYRLM